MGSCSPRSSRPSNAESPFASSTTSPIPVPIPVPPPPETGPEAIESLPIDTRGVAGIPDLMHHKYVVRDGDAVWTGSTNWTDDSWTRQENVIATVRSQKIAYAYTLTFDQLWESGQVAHTGSDPRPQQVNGAQVRAWFCPEHGEALSHRVAKHIGKARERVRIASPVLTSGPILATLVEVLNESRCDVRGIVDDTQVDEVFHQWRTNGVSEWKVPLLQRVLEGAEFSGKASVPWTPESLHDFMHAKVVVADDTTFVGSFNFSRSGERNAENVLEIADAAIADRMAAYVDELRARYPRATIPASRPGAAARLRPPAPLPNGMLTNTSHIAQGNPTPQCLTSRDMRNAPFVQGRST